MPAASASRLIADLLRRQQGATLDELIAATGWLPYSARAALTGLRRNGCTLEKSSRADGKTAYRIVPPDDRWAAMLPRAGWPEAMPLDPKQAAAEAEIGHLRGLDLGALQARWHSLRGRPAPRHLPKHLLPVSYTHLTLPTICSV